MDGPLTPFAIGGQEDCQPEVEVYRQPAVVNDTLPVYAKGKAEEVTPCIGYTYGHLLAPLVEAPGILRAAEERVVWDVLEDFGCQLNLLLRDGMPIHDWDDFANTVVSIARTAREGLLGKNERRVKLGALREKIVSHRGEPGWPIPMVTTERNTSEVEV